jgi:Ca2+-binding RTX toxin-like protein
VSSFISSVGVNVHMNFSGTAYTNVGAVQNAMTYLGFNTMRDMGAQANTAPYDTLAKAGFKFDFFAPGGQYQLDNATMISRLHSFAAAHPGSIVSLEGPNEINNWPVTYTGLSGNAAGAAFQKAFFDAASNDSLLNPIKMINLSIGSGSASAWNGLGDMSKSADIGNSHVYMSYGNQPNVQMSTLLSYAQSVTPGMPISITETGYPTLASDSAQGVDEHTQAVLTLNTVMDATKLGVVSTYLYELVDDPYSGGGAWNNGGLFKTDWTAKPAATALHNLTTILTTGQGDTAAAAPSYTVSGLSGYNANMAMHEANGTYDIVVWREPDVWDSNTHTEIKASAETATIQLNQAVSSYSVYDPMTGTTAVSSGGSTSTIQVQVTDHPVIIELHGAGSATAAAPSTPTTTTPTTPPATSPTEPVVTAPTTPTTTTPTGPTIAGTTGNDKLWGAASGYDTMLGGAGHDTLYGGSGAESINGGAGNDLIYGKAGADTLAGGGGSDHFVFDTAISTGADKIVDFNTSQNAIYLDHHVFTALTTTGALSSAAFYVGSAAHDSSDRIIYNSQSGDLIYDADGTGSAQGQVFAHLSPQLAFKSSNFVVF